MATIAGEGAKQAKGGASHGANTAEIINTAVTTAATMVTGERLKL
jgi:hypothetical protein